MLFELVGTPGGIAVGRVYTLRPASDLGVREKAIEDWIASRPEMLFQAETLLIIGQSISGQSMADVLALDATGRLVVVEVKRDWSDRETVGQLLEYASSLKGATYEQLDDVARRYANWPGGSLIERFRDFAERPDYPVEHLGHLQRIVIVAPDADQGLRNIVGWLKSYGVPIYFVSFGIYSDPRG